MIVINLWSLLLKKLHLSKYKGFFRLLFWLAIVVSYTAAMLPQDITLQIYHWSDKAQHVLAFVVLGLLLRLAYPLGYWYALLWLIAYGGFIEVSQYFTPDRMSEYRDIVADTVGALIGLKLYKYLYRVFK